MPITRLNFGRTNLVGSSSRFEIGPLECSGSRMSSVNEGERIITLIPTNCNDLFQIGHVLTGFYSVLVGSTETGTHNKTLLTKTIFCDFSQSPVVGVADGKYFNAIPASPSFIHHEYNPQQSTMLSLSIDEKIDNLRARLQLLEKVSPNYPQFQMRHCLA